MNAIWCGSDACIVDSGRTVEGKGGKGVDSETARTGDLVHGEMRSGVGEEEVGVVGDEEIETEVREGLRKLGGVVRMGWSGEGGGRQSSCDGERDVRPRASGIHVL